MSPNEGESCEVVIKFCIPPRILRVAGGAILAQAPFVDVFSLVASDTCCWCELEVFGAVCIEVTIGASDTGMPPNQWKCSLLVVEFSPIAIDAVMTGQALISKIQQVLVDIDWIEILMAGEAGIPLKGSKGLCVTILALKITPLAIGPVSSQGKSQVFMF